MGPAPDDPAVRSTLGAYRLLSEVGRDPLGVLFLACPAGARTFPKWAILRRMHAGLARDPAMVHAFLAATQAAVRMVHKNIASTFDSGGKSAQPWAAREYLSGATVLDLVAGVVARRARMPWALAGYIVAEAADGVAAVRARLPDKGPPMGFLSGSAASSVFVTRAGEIKIVDGCLPLVDGEPLVDSQALPYKPFESKPLPGATSAQRAGRADAFGLGVILWELIAGRRLFAGKDDDETQRLLKAGVVPQLRGVSSAPPFIDVVVQGAIGLTESSSGAPAIADAASLAAELRKAVGGEERRAGAEDVARTMAEMFAAVLAEQDEAVNQAWQREKALQAIGELPPEVFSSETDLTIPLGETVQETTTETALGYRPRRGPEGFDEIPTIPRGGASMIIGSASWRSLAAAIPAPLSSNPAAVSSKPAASASLGPPISVPKIEYFSDDEPTGDEPTMVPLPKPPSSSELPDSAQGPTEVFVRSALPAFGPSPPETFARPMPPAAGTPPLRPLAPPTPLTPLGGVPALPDSTPGPTAVFKYPDAADSAPGPTEVWAGRLPEVEPDPDSAPGPTEVWARPPPPAPPTPLPTPQPQLAGLFESESDADDEDDEPLRPSRGERPPARVIVAPEPPSMAAIPLVLPPVERAGLKPLSERRPMPQPSQMSRPTMPPMRAMSQLQRPTGRRVRRRSVLLAGALGFGMSSVVIVAVGWYLRFAPEPDSGVTPTPTPTPTSSAPQAGTSAGASSPVPSASSHGRDDPWQTVGAGSASAAPPPSAPPATSSAPLPVLPVDQLPRAPDHAPSRGTRTHRSTRSAPADSPADDVPVPPAAPAAGGGLLSVFCTPACDQVYDGSRKLGPSPVFKVPASAGLHRLRLRVGPIERVVTATVVEGETAVVRENVE
jgi:serine/threonine-protein kinase